MFKKFNHYAAHIPNALKERVHILVPLTGFVGAALLILSGKEFSSTARALAGGLSFTMNGALLARPLLHAGLRRVGIHDLATDDAINPQLPVTTKLRRAIDPKLRYSADTIQLMLLTFGGLQLTSGLMTGRTLELVMGITLATVSLLNWSGRIKAGSTLALLNNVTGISSGIVADGKGIDPFQIGSSVAYFLNAGLMRWFKVRRNDEPAVPALPAPR